MFDNNTRNENIEASNAAGLFNQASELNSGELANRRVPPAIIGNGYFDNAQDEATGSEAHKQQNASQFEEEKQSSLA